MDTTMNAPARRHYLIYTDGSCRGNPGPGGWGAVLQLKSGETVDREREIAGGTAKRTTNNRMELRAAIEALRKLKEKDLPVTVRSDSTYLINGMTKWLPVWRDNDWNSVRGSGAPVPNQDLWKTLDALSMKLGPTSWEWVRGHGNDPLNVRSDRLARAAVPA